MNPSAATYSYVLLPNQSADQVSAYAANPDVAILENSAEAQGVLERTLNLEAVNFWIDGGKTVDLIASDGKASVMVQNDACTLELALSDPTQANRGSIHLGLGVAALAIATVDPELTVEQLSPTIQISIQVNNSAGRTLGGTFVLSTCPGPSPRRPFPSPG